MLWNWRRVVKIWGSLTAIICVLLYLFSPSVRTSESHVGSSKQTRNIYVPARVYRVYVGVDQDRWSNRSALVRLPQPPPLLIGRGDAKNIVPPDVQNWALTDHKVRPPPPFVPPAPPRPPPSELSDDPPQLGRAVPPLMGVQAPNGETHSAWSEEARLRREARKTVRARNHASFMQLQAGGSLSPYERALYSHTAPPKPNAPPNADISQMYVPSENDGPYHKNDEVAPLRSQFDWNRGVDSLNRDSATFPQRDLDVGKSNMQNSILRTRLSNENTNDFRQTKMKRSAWANTFNADPDGPPVRRNEGRKLWKDLLGAMHGRKEPRKNYAQTLSADEQISVQLPPAKPHAPPNADTFQMYAPSENRGSYHKSDEVAPRRSQYDWNRNADPANRDATLLSRDLDVGKSDVQNSFLATEKVSVLNQAEKKRSAWANTFNTDPDGPPVHRNEGRKLWEELLGAMHDKKEFPLNSDQTLSTDKPSLAQLPPANIPSRQVETLSREREPKSNWVSEIDLLLRDEKQTDLSRHNTQLLEHNKDVMSLGSQTAAHYPQQQLQQSVVSMRTNDQQSIFQPVDARNGHSLPQNTFQSPSAVNQSPDMRKGNPIQHEDLESVVITDKATVQEKDLKISAPSQHSFLSIKNPLINKRSSKRKTPSIFRKIRKARSPFLVDNSIPSEEDQDDNRVVVETKNVEVDKVDVSLPSDSQVAHRDLSLADFSKIWHRSKQQATASDKANIQVTPKVDTAASPSEISPNGTKCATITKTPGHVMALSYFDQITTSVRRIASLQCWASQLGMSVVEPAFRDSSFGAPKTSTSVKFSDLFDELDWNDLMSQNCYTPLKRWDGFLYHTTARSLILVQLVYPQGPPKGIFGEKMDCTFTRLEEYYNKVLKPVGFTIARKLCIDFSRQPYLSSEDFKRRILGNMDPSKVTVLFNQWRGICSGAHCPGSHLVTLTDSSCSYNSILPSLLDFLTPSEQLFRDAQSYVVQKMNAASEYGAVMLRWERVPYTQECISNILEQWRTLASSANMALNRQAFLATDIGKFGSYELKKNGVPNYIFQETEKLIRNLFRKPWSFDNYEQTFLDVSTSSNPGYVSLLEKTISAQARCLLLVGRGVFQEHTLHMFKQLQPQNHCYKMIARC